MGAQLSQYLHFGGELAGWWSWVARWWVAGHLQTQEEPVRLHPGQLHQHSSHCSRSGWATLSLAPALEETR